MWVPEVCLLLPKLWEVEVDWLEPSSFVEGVAVGVAVAVEHVVVAFVVAFVVAVDATSVVFAVAAFPGPFDVPETFSFAHQHAGLPALSGPSSPVVFGQTVVPCQ